VLSPSLDDVAAGPAGRAGVCPGWVVPPVLESGWAVAFEAVARDWSI
jgi:hypothetical protein